MVMSIWKAFTGALTIASVVRADFFQYSAGWTPGQEPTQAAPSSVPTFSPPPEQEKPSWTSLFTSGPIGNLLSRSGINATERLAEAQEKSKLPWDERITMITDYNYEELIFNENFETPEEEAQRVWFIIVSGARNQRTSMSVLVDEEFNKAYNESLNEGDLPHIRWGRIDYLNVTRLTTKWAVWKAPMYIFAMDRGKTLRFLSPQAIGAKSEAVREFLTKGTYLRLYPWVGPWAPGGKYEAFLNKFALFQEFIYLYMSKIPTWLLMMLSGAMGSLLLSIFHRKPSTPTQKKVASKPAEIPKPVPPTVVPEPPAAAPSPKSGTGSMSKRKKKH